MDADAFAFHAAEPGHLAFCELVDGSGKLYTHLLVCELPYQIKGYKFVLQSVVDKVFGHYWPVVWSQGGMRAVDQSSDFFYHSFFQSGIQASVDTGISFVSAYPGTYILCALRQEGGALYRMFGFVNRYLKGSYKSLARVVVGRIVERLQ